jgi:cell division protein FtsI (penicillin-binding protein 3)
LTRSTASTRRLPDPDRRLAVALLVCLFVLSLLAGRLLQIQGLDASALSARAQDTRSRTITLPAHRGDITDSNGAVLATTVERSDITVDQTIVGRYARRVGRQRLPVGVAGAAQDLSPLLGVDVRTLTERLTGSRRFAYVAKDVSPTVWRRVARLAVPGVLEEPASRRTYPAGRVGASVIGFVARDGRPLAGVERSWDGVLAGRDGSLTYERSPDGPTIPTGVSSETEPRPGLGVRLTIDRDLQWTVQQALAAQVSKTRAEAGYAVVLDPRSGDVLSLASEPTFDANDPGAAPEADRGNRALLDVFEPGSISKVITAAAALEEKVVTPGTRMLVDDTIRRAGRTFHDSHGHPPEKLTFAGVLAQSSNVGTVQAGERLPPATMHDYLSRFGVGRTTGVGLPESRGILAAPKDWSGTQRYTVLFGQGLAVTALQSAGVFATLANDGVRVSPRIVSGTVQPDGSVRAARPPARIRVVSSATAGQMRQLLESVVEEGTARTAEIKGYRVAGKTGTSQAPDERCGCYRGYTASFIGMAPADDPQLVVAVILQRPVNGYYGGVVAAPVFQEIMRYALATREVAPTGTHRPDIPLDYR